MASKTYNSEKQMDYNGLLLFHLDRIGLVCASNFLESVNSNHMALVSNPNTAGETSIEWCINHLRAMIPDDLLDAKFKNEMTELKKKIDEREDKHRTPLDNFRRMNIIINLLHRRGLLIQQKVVGLAGRSNHNSSSSSDSVEEFWDE